MKLIAKKGEIITTEETNTPVYELTQDIYKGDLLRSSQFKTICDLPNPVTGGTFYTEYNGEKFMIGSPKRFKFHFQDGYR